MAVMQISSVLPPFGFYSENFNSNVTCLLLAVAFNLKELLSMGF